VRPLGAEIGAVRALVADPAWGVLRALRFTGPLSPAAVRELAQRCTLRYLEELDLTLGNPADPFAGAGALGAMLGQVIRAFMTAVAMPGLDGPRWAEFGSALEALAAARWVGGLRRLRIDSGQHRGLTGFLRERLPEPGGRSPDLIPDSAVLALAGALDRKKLDELVLPRAVVGPAAREELKARLGRKVVFE
jgi:hypothetical protein